MSEERFPPGWDAERVRRLIARYDGLDEEQQVAEDKAAQDLPDAPRRTWENSPCQAQPDLHLLVAA